LRDWRKDAFPREARKDSEERAERGSAEGPVTTRFFDRPSEKEIKDKYWNMLKRDGS
jgi:hypothetical protein